MRYRLWQLRRWLVGRLYWLATRRCPCESEFDDPGPHVKSCPWNDPEYGENAMSDRPTPEQVAEGICDDGFMTRSLCMERIADAIRAERAEHLKRRGKP